MVSFLLKFMPKAKKLTFQKRPKIPLKTQWKLWVAASGRCEFLGCNKLVWRDTLTLSEDNYSHIAHIISWTPTGPRGDVELSPKIATEFSNLMLMCLEHSKLIDGRKKNDYTVEILRAFKQEHERRIQLQTSLTDNLKTKVVRFIAPIGDRPVNIALEQTYQAVLNVPHYPEEREVLLDFTEAEGRGTKAFWKNSAQEITRRYKEQTRRGSGQDLPNHLSIFALGPIPFLIHLGNVISDTIPSDLYQKHRDTDNWIWKPTTKANQIKYKISRAAKKKGAKDVALLLSVSGKVQRGVVKGTIPANTPTYEISIDKPSYTVMNTLDNLNSFRVAYRTVLDEIRDNYGHDTVLHLFPAIPSPVAIACGQDLLPKVDPHLLVYDYDHQVGGYIQTLKIN